MSILSVETKEVADGVVLYKEPEGSSSYIFSLYISSLTSLEVKSDFTGSENLYLTESSSLQTLTLVHPFSKTKLATLKLLNEWKIQSKFSFKTVDAPKALILEAMKKERNEIKIKLDNCKSALSQVSISLTSLPEIEKILKSSNLVFTDFDFPPQDFLEKVCFAWKRLVSVYPSSKLLPEFIEPFDIIEGDGKDFWVKSAIEVLAERPECIKRLFITKQVNPFGIYRVKICKNNKWTFVTVDDYVPFLPNGTCLICTAVDKTYWPCLLEKAYCKAFASYEVINSNALNEILMDFTGCPCDLISLAQVQVDELWDCIVKSVEKGFLVCFFDENSEKAQVACVINCFVLDERGILQCRNLEEEERKTRWSKGSKLWTSKNKAKINPSFDLNSFYFEIDEALQSFNKMCVCKLKNWFEFRHKSEFSRHEDTFCKSQVYYSVQVAEDTNLIITLQQEDERDIGVIHCRNYMDIGLFILQLQEDNTFEILSFKDLSIERSTSIDIPLPPGTYIVLPFTSGCLIQGPSSISPEKSKLFLSSGLPNPFFSSALADIFNKHDSKDEQILQYDKFKQIFDKVGKTIYEAEFRQKILKKFQSSDDGITLEGFQQFWYQQAKTLNEETIWEWLETQGYDRDFYSVLSRIYFISFHSDNDVNIEVRKNSCGFEDIICKYLISKNGVEFESDGNVKVHYYFSKEVHCYFYGVTNMNDEGIECTLDCSESENMMFYFKAAAATRFVGPGDLEYVMPALALPAAENFFKAVKVSYKKLSDSP